MSPEGLSGLLAELLAHEGAEGFSEGLADRAYAAMESIKMRDATEFATLSAAIGQLEAGDAEGALKMLRRRAAQLTEAHADQSRADQSEL